MFKLGEKQELIVVKTVDFGVYLGEKANATEKVLLPAKQVPKGTKPGDRLEVFLYKDSSDRLIATTNTPKLTLGEMAVLEVKQTGGIGAFLDWGLEKDLLLPFREQTAPVAEGRSYLVALYIDKSERLCATMKLYERLRTDSPYQVGAVVEGIIYDRSKQFGLFVAVDYIYSGLIPGKEVFGNLRVGDKIEARVTRVREDGKLDLSVRQKAYLQMEDDAEVIRKMIEDAGGKLPFTDQASPELIREQTSMSKAAFKRAVGRLLKAGAIEIREDGIYLKA